MATDDSPVSSGNSGLDEILCGGFTPQRLYLIEGHPGTGKTTLGLQFLLEGLRNGEKGLYVTLSETAHELRAAAKSHGWSLDGIELYELIDPTDSLNPASQYTMFEPSEIELNETTQGMLERVRDIDPSRVVIDSLSEMRMLAQSALRFRRQVLAMKQFFVGQRCTVLMLDDKSVLDQDLQLQSIAHGVIGLDRPPTTFGAERRQLRVLKFRGKQFLSGWHDYTIEKGGLTMFPRIAEEPASAQITPRQPVLSGNDSLDSLLGGGVSPGTSTLMLGPAGVGKSTCATMYAVAAAQRGERAVIFAFDENVETLRQRSAGLGMELRPLEQEGRLQIIRFSPGEITPGQFAHRVRESVDCETDGGPTTVVVIDSLNGYMSAMPEERFLQMQMHELLNYLAGRRIATFLIVAQHGMLGVSMQTPVDASYLADTVVLFRYFESAGEIRQAISVVKKRSGQHERSIREFRMRDGKITVGRPLTQFHGILAGTPTYDGSQENLERKHESDESS